VTTPSACGTAREVGTFSNRLPADMVVTNKAHRDIAEKIWKLPEGTIPDKPGYHAVLQNRMLKDGLLNAYWVQVNNNLQAGANSNEETWLGYRNPENFIVVSDAYPSVTALAADLILPLALFRWPNFTVSNLETLVMYAALALLLFFPPPFFHDVQHCTRHPQVFEGHGAAPRIADPAAESQALLQARVRGRVVALLPGQPAPGIPRPCLRPRARAVLRPRRPRPRPFPSAAPRSAGAMLARGRWRRVGWRQGTKGPLAARFADEYNTPFPTLDDVEARRQRIFEACEEAGRDPIRFSVMVGYVVGRDRAELDGRAVRLSKKINADPEALLMDPPSGWVVGDVEQALGQLKQLKQAGVSRVMCQHLLHDDLDAVERENVAQPSHQPLNCMRLGAAARRDEDLRGERGPLHGRLRAFARRPAGGVPLPLRTVGVRQDDHAAHDRGV